MALTWNLENCKDWESLKTDAEWPVTDMIIWATMFTDIGWQITEENVAEFYSRIHLLEVMDGAFMNQTNRETGEVEPYFLTPEDVVKRVGLQTNVAPKTHLQFMKRVVERNMKEWKSKANAALADMKSGVEA